MLHISIRPQQAAIVRNHLQNQIWGHEESHGGNPIIVNQQFELRIMAEVMHYKISVNGRHFCVFRHRLPLSDGKYISVNGGCTIQSITIENENSHVHYPQQIPSYPIQPRPIPNFHQHEMGFVPHYPIHTPSYPMGGPTPPPPPPYPGEKNFGI